MNEQIRLLLTQAGVHYEVLPKDTVYEKFAELIVNECCQMMLDMETKYPANLTVREIKKHFGV